MLTRVYYIALNLQYTKLYKNRPEINPTKKLRLPDLIAMIAMPSIFVGVTGSGTIQPPRRRRVYGS